MNTFYTGKGVAYAADPSLYGKMVVSEVGGDTVTATTADGAYFQFGKAELIEDYKMYPISNIPNTTATVTIPDAPPDNM